MAGTGRQGQQAFISYGQQSNDKLLQYYGFVEARNPADNYVMTTMPQRLEVRSTSQLVSEAARLRHVQASMCCISRTQSWSQLSFTVLLPQDILQADLHRKVVALEGREGPNPLRQVTTQMDSTTDGKHS